MQAKELFEKVLELQQLNWWLENPTVKSFFLSVYHDGNDEGRYYKTIENNVFYLTTDILDEDEDYYHDSDDRWYDYEKHPNFSTTNYYPIDINESYDERIFRPKMSDQQIQERINYIVSTINE